MKPVQPATFRCGGPGGEPCGTTVFSIVTPSYNQGDYLAQTIESVISQAGDFLIDYIVMDGGSEDGSVDIVRRYESLLKGGKWPIACRGISFRWESAPDAGQADAIAKGFGRAEGDIFAWLNSDDVYHPGALATAARFFGDHPNVGLLYGDAHYCDSEGATVGKYRTGSFDLARLAYANIVCQPSAFFRAYAYREAGGVDPGLRFAMDLDLWIRIAQAFPCRHIPCLLSSYRLHEESKTVRPETLYQNSEEALSLALKHFGWAPVTRVYNSCSFYCQARLPGFLARRRGALAAATVCCTLLRSLWLNRGVNRRDLALLNGDNFAKLKKSRMEIMTGTKV